MMKKAEMKQIPTLQTPQTSKRPSPARPGTSVPAATSARRVGDWIAYTLCFDLPHRQFVFTTPRPLRGIFRKRRKFHYHLFQIAMESLRDWMRIRLDLPDGQLVAVAAVQTFGDYLVFHPHPHVLAITGLVDRKNRCHLMPVESIEPLAELFRHRFIDTLLREESPPVARLAACGLRHRARRRASPRRRGRFRPLIPLDLDSPANTVCR